jgi:hypothetical protein
MPKSFENPCGRPVEDNPALCKYIPSVPARSVEDDPALWKIIFLLPSAPKESFRQMSLGKNGEKQPAYRGGEGHSNFRMQIIKRQG